MIHKHISIFVVVVVVVIHIYTHTSTYWMALTIILLNSVNWFAIEVMMKSMKNLILKGN